MHKVCPWESETALSSTVVHNNWCLPPESYYCRCLQQSFVLATFLIAINVLSWEVCVEVLHQQTIIPFFDWSFHVLNIVPPPPNSQKKIGPEGLGCWTFKQFKRKYRDVIVVNLLNWKKRWPIKSAYLKFMDEKLQHYSCLKANVSPGPRHCG